MWVNVPLPVTQ